jgi:hypothetical protein
MLLILFKIYANYIRDRIGLIRQRLKANIYPSMAGFFVGWWI